ncbi:MAG: lipid A deacylase LpxR family protein [Bacteroidales bacterium]|nr:lipid A deacylase LpxR family protein [Bacteroidales bacterium]
MIKLFIIALLIFIVPSKYILAQVDINENTEPHFVFTWDNDVLFYTDYYYTQGLFFRYSEGFLKKNPINYILPSLPNSVDNYSLSVIQEMFTPLEIRDSVIRIDDRPYAGLLYIRSERLSVNSKYKLLIRSSLDLGIRGPHSYAQYAQYYYHKIGDILLPQGWQYQLSDYPIINYNIAVRKQLYRPNKYVDLSSVLEMRLGTIYSDVSFGGILKTGLFRSVFEEKYDKDFQLSAQLAAYWKIVAYNGTMQGDLKNNPNVYEIKVPYIERYVASYSAKANARYKNFELSFEWIYLNPEFEMGLAHRYNSLSLCLYW